MNTFAENPVLFFMDNMPPIVSVNASKDVRKIVELADTGCDARLPVQMNNDARYSPKLYKIKSSNWNLHTEDDKYDKYYGEKFRIKNKQNIMDVEDYHFNQKNDATNQYRWQRYPQHDDTTDDKYKRVGNRSPTREFRTKLKMTAQEAHRWKDDKHICQVAVPNPVSLGCSVNSERFPKSANTSMKDRRYESPPRRGSMIGGAGSKKFVCSDHPKMDLIANEREAGSNRDNKIHMVLDYPENFETADYPMSNASKCHKDHHRRSNRPTCEDDVKNPTGQPSPRYNRFSRHSPRNTKTAGSLKSDQLTKDWYGMADKKIRSRTRSPPIDRRKETRTFQKTCCENVDQCQNRYESELGQALGRTPKDVGHSRSGKLINSGRFVKKLVDRAVDKDSLSNLLNVATSIQPFTDTINPEVVDTSKEDRDKQRNTRTTYWDFIPLDDENSVEYKTNVSGMRNQSLVSYNCRRPTESLSGENARDPRAKGKSPVSQKTDGDEGQRNSLNLHSYDDPSAAPETALETTHDRNFDLPSTRVTPGMSCPKNPKAAEASKKGRDEQQRCNSKGEVRLLFGYPRKPIGSAKTGLIGDREEKKLTNVLELKGTKANIVERTAACLKRKMGKSWANGVSAAFRSELPIRIGNRLRSRNPSVAKYRFNGKPCVANEEEKAGESKELSEDSIDQQNSVRSRTKPKIKPSILHNRIIVGSVEAVESFQQMEDSQTEAHVKDFLKDELVRKSELLENHNNDQGKDDGPIKGCVDVQTTLSMLNPFDRDAYDKFENNIENKEMYDFNQFHATDDERRMTKLANGTFGRKTYQRNEFKKPSPPPPPPPLSTGITCNGFKEICCFHLNDAQNIVCNSYYDKDNRKLDPFRLKKPTVVRSRF